MKIGDRVFVRGYIDEIRKDTVIIRNAGGYFGTVPSEVITGELPSAQPERKKPVFKTGESVYHVSYADGTGGFEKNKWADWTCPDCGWFVGEQYIPRRHNQQKCNYCARCGCGYER